MAAVKLMRFLSRKGDVSYGAVEPNTPDLTRIVAGAPFGDLTVTADIVIVDIEGIGELTNPVIREVWS